MTSPDPVPEPAAPAAAMVTTEGSTWSATGVTGHPMAELAAALPLVLLLLPEDVQPASAAAAATGTSTHGHQRRLVMRGLVTQSPSDPSRWSRRRRRRSRAARAR